ncbi:hypothetical protein [Streptomyces chrestomyceticus]|uniref:hypothetical protein n=1 Tax=Streptomyces chrestomyceticus TaxID=68185 RepID=UPI00341080A9
MRLDPSDDARRRRSRLGAQAFTLPAFERRVRFLATTKGLSIPTARAMCRLWDRLEREHGAVAPEVFTAALTDELHAGKPWARDAINAVAQRNS